MSPLPTARLSIMMLLEYVIWGSWLPLLALYALYFLLDLPERRVRRRERARTPGRTSGENTPPLRGELVKMWMASAERTRKSLSGDEER